MTPYSRGSARRSVFQTAAFRLVSQVATLAGYVVLVRAASEETFGRFSLLLAVIPAIGAVASLGIEQTLRRFQPEFLALGQPGAAAWLGRCGLWAQLLANLVVIAALLAAWQLVAQPFGLLPYRAEFALFGLVIVLHFQVTLLRVALAARMENGLATALTVLLPLGKLATYAVLGPDGLTLVEAIVAEGVGYGAAWIALALASRRPMPGAPGGVAAVAAPDAEQRRRIVRYAAYNNFNDAGSLLLVQRTDTFFVAALLSPVAVGAYAFYTRLNEMASQWLPTRQLLDVIQPLMFAVPRAEAAQRLPRYFTLLMNTTMALQLPLTVYAVAYHRELVEVVFGGKFLEWSWVLPVVVAFGALNRFGEPATLVAQYEEKAKQILYSKAFGLANAAGIVLLAPVAGLLGVAVASGCAQLMKNGYIWWHVRRTARWANAGAVCRATLLIGAATVATCELAKRAMAAPAWVDLVVGALACGLALLAYLRTAALTSSDRQILAGVFGGREIRVLGWLGLRPRPLESR